ncbi:MAG: heme A synthase [Geminicoccaceae bacterium]
MTVRPGISGVRFWAGLTAVAVYALIILGGWVRSTNSGLSCPDWPTCYGQWVLTPADFAALGDVGYSYFQVMLEWGHRFMAAVVVGPLILVLAILTFRSRAAHPTSFKLGISLVVLLLVQASLGGLTVLDANSPWSVALHLGNALILFAAVLMLVLGAGPKSSVAVERGTIALTLIWFVALMTMITAAITAKSGASLACSSWPLCNDTLWVDWSDPQVRINATHRLLAALTVVGVVVLAGLSWRGGDNVLSKFLGLALAALLLEVALGATLVMLENPVWAAVSHQALGVLVFALITLALGRSLQASRALPRPASLGSGGHVGLRSA